MMKTLLIASICILLSVGPCFGKNKDGAKAEPVVAPSDEERGQITGNFEGKVKLLLGDKTVTNLGKKAGVVKGDIFRIYEKKDPALMNSIGRCAVVEVYDEKSVCEISLMVEREIGADTVAIKKIKYRDTNLYPGIFQLLTKVAEPYEPHKDITVYIHKIVDENKNETQFSEAVRKEIGRIFSQKKRIKLVSGSSVSKALLAYMPDEYAGSTAFLKEYLKRDGIDVIVSGTYRVNGGRVEIIYYKVDKSFEDLEIDSIVSSAPYGDRLGAVTAAYVPLKKEQNALCQVVYKPVYQRANVRDERSYIIEEESKNNPFMEYNLKRIGFNIVSPVEFQLQIDKDVMDFEKKSEQELVLPTGRHEITASFRKGYYSNDSLLYTAETVVKKSIILNIEKADDMVVLNVNVNPLPGRDNIEFVITKKDIKAKPTLKHIRKEESVRRVETYTD